MKASVTAIVPCWRCRETIKRAVDSIYTQTLLPEKVILVDDASLDGTAEFLGQLAKDYPQGWIETIYLKINSGPGNARNAGWDFAKTKYIAFLDADDSWHKDKIKLQYEWMMQHPSADLTSHISVVISSANELVSSTSILSTHRVTRFKLLFKNIILTRSVMLKTNLGFRFDEKKRRSEDYFLWLKVVFNNKEAYLLKSTLAFSYKPDYGHSGLTENMFAMELAELDTYYRCYQLRLISFLLFMIVSLFSTIKFIRRCLIIVAKKIKE